MEQNLKKIEVGTKESIKLKPSKVKIQKVEIRTVGAKGANKVVCEVKHPAKEETVEISAVKYENLKTKKMETSGLWINLDDENKIRKTSALATLLVYLGCSDIEALENKEIDTVEDEQGYLCFKAY